ncbi:YceG family protein [Bacilliculturomica massiliensis]|uniref:YceG family protein n=1 Tax=Bacilliculturomica massiliensis TaxID=1917867 RepID=UPI0010303877|nr:YceG family protein [Bacilliculturomica massiliensis]
MFECTAIKDREDYFKSCSARGGGSVFFGRLNGFSPEIRTFLQKYLDEIKRRGVFISERIQNPTGQQLQYFEEIMGLDFRQEAGFFDAALKKWLPRLNGRQRESVAGCMKLVLEEMEASGKNENIRKNGYIKFMCWLYYKFERILNLLGQEELPRILFEGYVNDYELRMLRILACAGCDILLLQYQGDEGYRKVDPDSRFSAVVPVENPQAFPQGFSVVAMVRETEQAQLLPEIHLEEPDRQVSTNTWLTGDLFDDSLKEPSARGREAFYYNMFVRIRGVEDAAVWESELVKWKLKLESQGRKVLLAEEVIRVPGVDETRKIPRKNYRSPEQLIGDLASYISFPKSRELEKLSRKAFAGVLQEESAKENSNMTRLTNRAICLLCWVNRYVPELFADWRIAAPPVFLLYGVCSNENEAVLLRFLSRIPVDVFEICPDLSLSCRLADRFLFDRTYGNSLPLGKFPAEVDSVRFKTAAYGAERELDTLMYQNTGLYRNRQFKKAIPVQLQTTYEEIAILWDQEAKYRPNFEVLSDRVMVPVICAKISGVPGSNAYEYWQTIASLAVEDTAVIYKLPYIEEFEDNPVRPHVTKFIRGEKLLFDKIKDHHAYQYGFLREDMQDYMLDKLQELLDRRLIEGTFTRGTEFTILSTALNLNKGFLRMIQKFDFTKKIPKLIVISTGEVMCTLGDSILVAYLSLLGFDVAIFTPTGYQNVEMNFTQQVLTEHQVGDYMYDLQAPNLKNVSKSSQRESLRDRLFRRAK